MTTVRRPFPEVVAPAYAEHVDGLRAGELVVRACAECGEVQWPPRALCPSCRGTSFAARPLERTGEVYTFTVVHRAFHPWFGDRVPYGVAVVDVTDAPGVRLAGLYDGPVEGLRCGLPVEGSVEKLGGAPGIVWRTRGVVA